MSSVYLKMEKCDYLYVRVDVSVYIWVSLCIWSVCVFILSIAYPYHKSPNLVA